MFIQIQKELGVSSRQTKGTRQNLLDAYLRIGVLEITPPVLQYDSGMQTMKIEVHMPIE